MKTILSQLLFFALLFSCRSLSGQNNALEFDGDGDYITLTPINGLPAVQVTDFTVELWFISRATGITPINCSSGFRRLFALGVTSNTTLFEVGECNGLLSVFWYTSPAANLVQTTTSIRDNQWHCLSVVRSANQLDVYLDGNVVLTDLTVSGTHNISIFSVGHGLAAPVTPGEDWLGGIDEVKLWNVALPASQLTACNPCVLTGSEPGLIAYWKFDEGTAGMNNTSPLITQVSDASALGNNPGTLHPFASTPDPGFALTGTVSNFVSSGAPLVYPDYSNLTLEIEHPVSHNNLTEICSGDPVYVCLRDALGNVLPPGAPFSPVITWECSTNGGQFTQVPGFSPTQFCFNVLPSVLTASCAPASKGFDDKVFRAVLVVTDPVSGNMCTYTSSTYPLRICCPVSTPTVVLNVQPPAALNGTLCEGDVVVIDVSLTNLPGWFPPAAGSVVTIDWCLNGVAIPLPPGTTQFSYPITVGKVDLCFEVKIKNCACPLVTAQTCLQVDPLPQCGTIIGCHPNLTLVASSPMLCYEICPFRDATICIDLPFTDCIPHWEFSFNNVNWDPLGTSNNTQNTNTLPCDDIGSPYAWPTGQQCIYYRIACHPESWPAPSGCEPCYSNTIKVCLKPTPTPIVAINGPDHICKGSSATLTVTNPQAVNYTWYCNGLVVGTGTSYSAMQQAWYWVVADNGCEMVESNHVFLTVCMVMATVTCPLDPNPCAKLNDPIFLSACASKSTCGGPLTYAWTLSPALPPPTITNGCDLEHLPPLTGTTYTVVVTDPFGCTGSASITVIPCQ